MALTFAQWMREQRKALDLTQGELAQRVNCAVVTIQKIEEGQRRPSKQMVDLLAQQLEIHENERELFVQLGRAEAEKLTLPDASRYAQLPTLLSSFIGRDQEIQVIRYYLTQPAIRLLTLTGPPGVGKTRLAVQAADELRVEFLDGVFFISLATACEPNLVLPTLARSLGFAQSGSGSILERLQNGLSHRSLLLVLDNFEQVVEAAPQIGELLMACPAMKVLATSRVALRIQGENLLQIHPLPVPDRLQTGLEANDNPETCESVKLFVARVKSFDPSFRLTAHNAAPIQEICTRLDGLPLAIELAAARLRVFSPVELAHQLRGLGQPLNILGDGPRDLPDRQRFLRSAIEWSYALLDEASKALYRRAGIFAGGFTFQALQAVAGIKAADALVYLVEHSLVRREGFDFQETARFSMLETLRGFALERLTECGEYDDVCQLHSDYFLNQTQAGGKSSGWLDWCEVEHDNLRLALQWLLIQRGGLQALQLCLALHRFWEMRGYHREAQVWYDTVMPLAGDAPINLLVQALGLRSIIAWQMGDFIGASNLCHRALAMCLDTSSEQLDEELIGPGNHVLAGFESNYSNLLINLARVMIEQGDYARVGIIAGQALDYCRSIQDTSGMCAALLHLGEAALAQDDLAAAETHLQQGWMLVPHEAPDFWGLLLLQNLGDLAMKKGENALAWRHLNQALQLGIQIRHNRPLTLVLAFLAGWLACRSTSTREQQLLAVSIWAAVWAQRNRSGLAFSHGHCKRIENWQAQTRAALGEFEWQTAWDQGVNQRVEQVIDWLKQLPPGE